MEINYTLLTSICPLMIDRISLSIESTLHSRELITSSILVSDCSVGNRLLM